MTSLDKKLSVFVTRRRVNTLAIDELVFKFVRELQRSDDFVRGLRDEAFMAAQRKWEVPLWRALLDFASDRLNQEAANQAKAEGIEPPPVRPAREWRQRELSEAMGGLDQGLISRAQTIVETNCTTTAASLSLPRLIAVLTSLERHWCDLGKLPSLDELWDECHLAGIGYAQACLCAEYGFASPLTTRPTLDELRCLRRYSAKRTDDSRQNELDVATWKTWSLGWLVTRAVLFGEQSTGTPG